jgi:hypothetical protein
MTFIMKAAIAGFFILLTANVSASEITWFTDIPPQREMMKKMRFAHGGPVEMGRDGLYIKNLWLQSGGSPQDAEYSHQTRNSATDILLLSPDGNLMNLGLLKKKHGDRFRFEMPQEGFYNLYLVEKFVAENTLNIVVTKAEVLKHQCSKGHDHTAEKMSALSLDDVPFEIVRERTSGEDFHTLISSGEDLTFRVLYKGGPAAEAHVRLITQKGWSKTVRTDKEGKVTYELIRDYYPTLWEKFDDRKRENSVIVAHYSADENGTYKGKPYKKVRYTATMTGSYYPSKQEYTSYLYGMSVLTFAFTASAAGIYIHRERRKKPYKEEPLAERN